jgi:hypothetical protein
MPSSPKSTAHAAVAVLTAAGGGDKRQGRRLLGLGVAVVAAIIAVRADTTPAPFPASSKSPAAPQIRVTNFPHRTILSRGDGLHLRVHACDSRLSNHPAGPPGATLTYPGPPGPP